MWCPFLFNVALFVSACISSLSHKTSGGTLLIRIRRVVFPNSVLAEIQLLPTAGANSDFKMWYLGFWRWWQGQQQQAHTMCIAAARSKSFI